MDSLAATLRARYETGDESVRAVAEEALPTGERAAIRETARDTGGGGAGGDTGDGM